jgi:hypothetical protein
VWVIIIRFTWRPRAWRPEFFACELEERLRLGYPSSISLEPRAVLFIGFPAFRKKVLNYILVDREN